MSSLLGCFSAAAGFYAGDSGLDPVSSTLTVLETYAAPSTWAQDPLARPVVGCCPQAGCLVALRCHLLQRLIDQRFQRLYGQAVVAAGCEAKERHWQRLFHQVDVNGNGEISMAEWLTALEEEANEELRTLFDYDSKATRRLARRLPLGLFGRELLDLRFGSVHEEADSSVDLEEFRKACRTGKKSL